METTFASYYNAGFICEKGEDEIPLRKYQTINFSSNSISAVINAHPLIEVTNISDNLLFVIVIPP
jgi:hypothetical protein